MSSSLLITFVISSAEVFFSLQDHRGVQEHPERFSSSIKSFFQKKAKELAKLLRNERPDYQYLKAVFRHLRTELNVPVVTAAKSLPDIPTEDELKQYYEIVWNSQNTQDLLIIKTLLYTGARVTELVNIKLTDVDFKRCQIRIESGKGGKDRMVPFPVYDQAIKKFPV